MSSSIRPEKTDVRRLIEASAWRTHLSENELESTSDFEVWLMSDIRNRKAWDSVQEGWELSGQHATSPELLDLRRQALGRACAVGRERRFLPLAIAVSVVLICVLGSFAFYEWGHDVYRTHTGERRMVTLVDGSQIQLDALTELRVDYSERARDLELISGQARFDVARDVERPFTVKVAGKKVVATGTAFNVDLLGGDLFVTLIEGKVAVLPKAAAAQRTSPVGSLSSLSTLKLKVTPIELEAGQQLAILEDGATRIAAVSIQGVTAWQSGQIVVEDEPLASVVLRVNRYSERAINLLDQQIASLRISGVFNTGDVDGFVAIITQYLPVKAEQGENAIFLRARPVDLEGHVLGQS